MSITLVTGLIYNISCKQSDSEDPVTLFLPLDVCVVGWSAPTPEQVAERTNLLFKAIGSNNVEQAKLCIKTGADVNAKDNNGSTALYFANYKSKDRFLEPKEGIIAQLLAAGARE